MLPAMERRRELAMEDDKKQSKRHAGDGQAAAPACQADKCSADLTQANKYHLRHKVCERHAKASVVVVAGLRQRFCQQCSRQRSLLSSSSCLSSSCFPTFSGRIRCYSKAISVVIPQIFASWKCSEQKIRHFLCINESCLRTIALCPWILIHHLQQNLCRFHELSEFDETKRSCRRRLAGHNERRRKSSSETQAESSGRKGGGSQLKENHCRQGKISLPPGANLKDFQIRWDANHCSPMLSLFCHFFFFFLLHHHLLRPPPYPRTSRGHGS